MKHLILLFSLISINAFSETICFGSLKMVPDFQVAPYFQADCAGQKVKSKTEGMWTGKKQEARLEAQVTAQLREIGYTKISRIGGLAVYEKSEQSVTAPHCLIMNNKKKLTERAQHKAEHFLRCSQDGIQASLVSKDITLIEGVLNNGRYVKVADTEYGPLYRQK